MKCKLKSADARRRDAGSSPALGKEPVSLKNARRPSSVESALLIKATHSDSVAINITPC